MNKQMTKPNSPPIKRDASPSGYEDSLTKTMQEADDAIKNEQEEFAELTPADREANARTQKFVENLSREDRSKFYSMIGNDEFFKMFGEYAKRQSPTEHNDGDKDMSPPARDESVKYEE